MSPPRHRQSWVGGALVALVLLAGTGCATGERPTLAADRSTGYPDIDEIVDRVHGLSAARYTAHYDVLVRFGNSVTAVSASQSDGDRRSLTIGDVRFVVHGQITKTCTVSTGSCTATIDAGRVSDVQMTPDFFGTSLIAKIGLDASRAIGEPVTSVEESDGGQATCVAIPITDSTTTYCVLDDGVLARMDAPDLVVTMTSYSDEVDERLYSEGGTTTTTSSGATTTLATSTTTSSGTTPATTATSTTS